MQGLPKFFEYPLLSQEWVKLRTSNFVRTFIDRSEQKPIKNVGKSSRGRTQGLSKIFRAPICRAHRAVIFAVAQLSCLSLLPLHTQQLGSTNATFLLVKIITSTRKIHSVSLINHRKLFLCRESEQSNDL